MQYVIDVRPVSGSREEEEFDSLIKMGASREEAASIVKKYERARSRARGMGLEGQKEEPIMCYQKGGCFILLLLCLH